MRPLGENATNENCPLMPMIFLCIWRVDTSQRLIVVAATARVLPSGEKVTQASAATNGDFKLADSNPVDRSQSLAVSFVAIEASSLPSGEKARDCTENLCPARTDCCRPVVMSHK